MNNAEIKNLILALDVGEGLSEASDALRYLYSENIRLKDILRRDPKSLELTLSIGDYHVKRRIPEEYILNARYPLDLLKEEIALAFHNLRKTYE